MAIAGEHERVREPLRVLVADEDPTLTAITGQVLTVLGHQVAAVTTTVTEAARLTRRARPDVALVALRGDQAHALEMIGQIVQEAECPVVAMLPGGDPPFVEQAARRGVFAYVVDCDPAALQGALDIVLRRFAEYHNLEGAFGRRAVTERAKGILMERHQVDERHAFDLMRDHARRSGRKLVDVAEAVLDSHLLLGTGTPAPGRPRHGVRAHARERSAADTSDPRAAG